MITLHDYAMGRDELFPEEWELAKPNAEDLLLSVNAALEELFPGRKFDVSSGWRPKAINDITPGAAKNSWHIKGKAIDIKDRDRFLRDNLRPNVNPIQAQILKKHGLFMENPDSTPTWIHLDNGIRQDRPSRIFTIK